jgi:hypothetical protein
MSGSRLDSAKANRLMSQLFSDPDLFEKEGLANELLKQFFRGYPLDQLRSLLRHENHMVLRSGIWIASELPDHASALLNEANELARHPDTRVRYFALDVIMLATAETDGEEFIRIVEALDDTAAAVADNGLFLLSRATQQQLGAAIKHFELADSSSPHLVGLRMLANSRSANPSDIKNAIQGSDPLFRKYGLAVAERTYDIYPILLTEAADSKDDFIRSLANHMLELHSIGQSRTWN